ncbi:MAG TPA: glycoside hydrolase family 44 protein [Myxococcales bacterium]|jgi:hypothetical protein
MKAHKAYQWLLNTAVLAAAIGCSGKGAPAPGTVSISITPSSAVVAAGSQQRFAAAVSGAADTSATWTVDEAAGGTIAGGIYTAPLTAGAYHVRATSSADSATFAEAVVQVTPASASLPSIQSFGAAPVSVNAGSSSTLSWSVAGATSVSIDNGVGDVSARTSVSVSPAATTTYTLTATNGSGSVTATATVGVAPIGAPTIGSVKATPSSIFPGGQSTLAWSVTGATTVSIQPGIGAVTGTNIVVKPSTSTVYTLTASNASGTATATAQVTVDKPVIASFGATPAAIAAGASATLSWSVAGASSIAIDQGVGVLTGSSAVVSPSVATTYTLTATNSAGSVTATAAVSVAGSFLTPPPVTGDAVVTLDSHTTTPISPFIYGINFDDQGGADSFAVSQGVGLWGSYLPAYTMARFGGNRMSGFNWENGDSNCGLDCGADFPNDTYLRDSVNATAAVGDAVGTRIANSFAHGASFLMTVPILGYVAKDALGNQPIPKAPAQSSPTPDEPVPATPASAHWIKAVARNPAGPTATPSTTDGSEYTDDMATWIDQRFPQARTDPAKTVWYELDNEPDIWSGTHAEIRGTTDALAPGDTNQIGTGFDELLTKSLAHAFAVKSVLPSAKVVAGAFAGWDGLTQLNFGAHPNGAPAGFTYYLDYFLQKLKAAESDPAFNSSRMVDAVDVHWYVQDQSIVNDDAAQTAAVIDAREQSPRSLWDPKYVENSWVPGAIPADELNVAADCQNGLCPIQLLPRLNSRASKFYPGTGFVIGEYWYGRGGDVSSAIANADVLGIFGRYGVKAATMWPNASNVFAYNTPNKCGGDTVCSETHAYSCALKAIDVFRNYDGAGAKFGDTAIAAAIADSTFTKPGTQNERITAYASMDGANHSRVVVVAINKSRTAALNTGIALTHDVAFHTAQVWRLTGTNGGAGGCTGPTRQADVTLTATNAFNVTLPVQSVTVLVLLP